MLTRRGLLGAAAATLVAACAPSGAPDAPGLYARPGRNEWPDEMRRLPADTLAMYRYAAANREVLRHMPCFCGCRDAGHTSNYDCYIDEALPDGRVRIDTMSFG